MRSIEIFEQLGYKIPKSSRTRVFNKLKLTVTEEITVDVAREVLTSIINSKSAPEIKAKAKELLINLSQVEKTKSKRYTLDIPQEILNKYGVAMEDVNDKYSIYKNHNLSKEDIVDRAETYRFHSDIQVAKLILEYWEEA